MKNMIELMEIDDAATRVGVHLERARTIIEDVVSGYFNSHNPNSEPHAVLYSFNENRIRTEIVENELAEINDAFKIIEAAIKKAESDEWIEQQERVA